MNSRRGLTSMRTETKPQEKEREIVSITIYLRQLQNNSQFVSGWFFFRNSRRNVWLLVLLKKAVFVLCGTCAPGGYPTKFIRGDFLQVQTLTFHHNITFLTGKVILSNTDNLVPLCMQNISKDLLNISMTFLPTTLYILVDINLCLLLWLGFLRQ